MFLRNQAADAFCKQATKNNGWENREYTIDKNVLVARVAQIDGAAQVFVAQVL